MPNFFSVSGMTYLDLIDRTGQREEADWRCPFLLAR